MKRLRYLFVAAGFCAYAQAADLTIIANTSVVASSISGDELKGVFLATKTSLSDGSHVEPVLEKGGPVHEAFVKTYLGKTDSALETYYRSLVFTGKASMPKTLGTDADVVSYVSKTKGAIGYVAAGAATDGVKTLEIK
jgi:ABC-type phosphate transport system substrate-binding protein